MTVSDLKRTAEYWAALQSNEGLQWADLALVRERINYKVTGNNREDWLSYTLRQHFAGRLPLARCYSLGCGHGEIERRLAQLNAFTQCNASDLSEGAIDEAHKAAANAGLDNIQYEIADANSLSLPSQTYDAIWAHASVHHFEKLEHVFAMVSRALKPGGLFILHEYIGPNRFQFPAHQRQVIQACLDLLPPSYRQLGPTFLQARPLAQGNRNPVWLARRAIDKWRDGDLLAAVSHRIRLIQAARSGKSLERLEAHLPTERSVIAVDPSEAVRSAEILPVLKQHFEIVEYKPLGGTILQFLLVDIAGNFEQDKKGQKLLQMFFDIEDALINAGVLGSDFAYIVATPR